MGENKYGDIFRSLEPSLIYTNKLWPSPASLNNYSSFESNELNTSVFSPPSDFFVTPPTPSPSATTENIKVANPVADYNYCTSYEEQETDNLETFEKILQSHEKNNTIEIEKLQTARSIKSKKIQKYTFFGAWVQEYIKRVVIKRNPTENERTAYEEIFPILEKIKVNPLIWPVAKYSFSKGMIIFDDLSAEGFSIIEDKTLTVRECSMVLMNLAEFHATSLILQFKNPVKFQALKLPSKEDTHSEFIAYLNDLSSKTSFNNIFDKTEVETLKVLIHLAQKDSQTKNKFSAICHGNLLPTNIFFKGKEVRFLDFKQMHYGSIARDVICFMVVNLKPSLYFNCFYYLLDYYFRCLTRSSKFDAIVNLNYEFTSESFKKEINRVTAYGILYSIWTTPVLYANSDEELKTFRTILDDTAEKLNLEFVNRIKKMLTLYHSHYIMQVSEVPNPVD